MVQLDGVDYEIETAENNAALMADAIDEYCSTNNVKDIDDNIISIDRNIASPLYLMLYGFGYLLQLIQNLIYNLGCSINLGMATERQLTNIGNLIGVKRMSASPTTIKCVANATSGGSCTITQGLTTTLAIEGDSVVFENAYEVTIPAGQSAVIILVSQTSGAYAVEAGTITFDETVTNLSSCQNAASIVGQEEETFANYRKRLSNRFYGSTKSESAVDAICSLTGVSMCNIYVNENPTSTATIHGITIPPRYTLLMVQGWNDAIPETYLSYMTAPTTFVSSARSITRNYTTGSGQTIPVHITTLLSKTCYIRIYTNNEETQAVLDEIKTVITRLNLTTGPGQSITTAAILELLQSETTYDYVDVQLSTDQSNWVSKIIPDQDEVLSFYTSTTEVMRYASNN